VNALTYAQFSPASESAFRTVYGALLLLQLLWTWPHARRFFSSERYGGYIESSPFRDRIHTIASSYAVISVWILVAVALLANRYVLAASAINFALAYYFFVHIRWQTILRGMGAPGHMNYWIAAFLLFLAIGDLSAPATPLRAMTVVAFRIDFALIMIFAGIYKITSGYARADGFERGLVNPWWGWFSTQLRAVPSRSPLFSVADHAAYITEILCGLSFFVPAAAPYGALLLAVSFLGVGAQIRLTFLAEMVAACCMLYIFPGSPPDELFARFLPSAALANAGAIANAAGWAISALLSAYVVMLPLAYAVMVANFYFRRRLPEPIQVFFDAWNRFFGLILWRVFTNDLINFYCDILERRNDGSEVPVRQAFRFSHVGEFICLASLFTTLKYYPNDPGLFERRMLRYVRSLPPHDGKIVFRYVRIEKGARRFEYLPVAEFLVDLRDSSVERRVLDARFDVSATEPGSPIHTTGSPGSYAPAATP
jgi:hypothetical protein